jgi:formylglycine-generating enzyme required for sulfatase activity
MAEPLPTTLTPDLPGGVPLDLRLIPAGSYRMGQRGGGADEEPVHRVVIPEDFDLGVYPVTQAQIAAWSNTSAHSDWFSHHREEIRKSSPRGMVCRYSNEPAARDRHPAVNITSWEARGFTEW